MARTYPGKDRLWGGLGTRVVPYPSIQRRFGTIKDPTGLQFTPPFDSTSVVS